MWLVTDRDEISEMINTASGANCDYSSLSLLSLRDLFQETTGLELDLSSDDDDTAFDLSDDEVRSLCEQGRESDILIGRELTDWEIYRMDTTEGDL